MRLPFAQIETSSGIKAMTPLKQVVAVNNNTTSTTKRMEEAPIATTTGDEATSAAKGTEGSPSIEEASSKMEELSVDSGKT